jgi:hypothetical protein
MDQSNRVCVCSTVCNRITSVFTLHARTLEALAQRCCAVTRRREWWRGPETSGRTTARTHPARPVLPARGQSRARAVGTPVHWLGTLPVQRSCLRGASAPTTAEGPRRQGVPDAQRSRAAAAQLVPEVCSPPRGLEGWRAHRVALCSAPRGSLRPVGVRCRTTPPAAVWMPLLVRQGRTFLHSPVSLRWRARRLGRSVCATLSLP